MLSCFEKGMYRRRNAGQYFVHGGFKLQEIILHRMVHVFNTIKLCRGHHLHGTHYFLRIPDAFYS
jgi:hypothetical protein